MGLERAAVLLLGLTVPVALALSVGCGARTGLLLEQAVADAGTPIEDAGIPGLDVTPRDVTPLEVCADASDTLVYVVTTDTTGDNFQILRFDPSSAQFTLIAPLVCPDPYQPFSMAVDRQGHAYVLYYDETTDSNPGLPSPPPGNIYEVNLNTGACALTSYVPNAEFSHFGMGFATDDVGGGETLYVASSNATNTQPFVNGVLGAIDESSLGLTTIGPFSPTVSGPELTGTGDGRLFAFWAPGGLQTAGSAISQIDKKTATVTGQATLPGVTQGGGWAFAFWGGDFYLFTNPGGLDQPAPDPTTIVQKYDPATGAISQIATYPETIVGAGVSTCAPIE